MQKEPEPRQANKHENYTKEILNKETSNCNQNLLAATGRGRLTSFGNVCESTNAKSAARAAAGLAAPLARRRHASAEHETICYNSFRFLYRT